MGEQKKGGDDDVVMLLSCFSVREVFLCGGEQEGEKLCGHAPNQFHGLCQAISA